MSTTHPVDHVEAYLLEVRERLADLPEEERAELLDDVTTHVREVAAEHGQENLELRLGSPSKFGDELRTSAGYTPADSMKADRVGWLRSAAVPEAHALRELVATNWPRFEPSWWLLRGALVVWLVVSLPEINPTLIPRVGGSALVGLLALLAGAMVSFALASRRPAEQSSGLRKLRVAAEVALAFFAFAHLSQVPQTRIAHVADGAVAQRDPCLRDSAGRAIGNLFAFDSEGKLIPQVLLTDQAGRAIDNLCPEQADPENPNGVAQTTYARDVNGAPVYNVFPRAQHRLPLDPLTGQPSAPVPVLAPAVVFPQIAPPAAQPAEATTTTVTAQP